ncbi:MAG: hypothetical protein A2X31_01230 [Elusimicrobia bacterium GWB2_63_22]|nr:MAG: hypothetical protein A2X31_01230 [Elusimicrobia bacterium GWB2_63_22]
MKNFAIHTAVIVLALAGSATAQQSGGAFGETFGGGKGFLQALEEFTPPAAPVRGLAAEKDAVKIPVNFRIRADFRIENSMTALDTNSGDTVSVYGSGDDMTARIAAGGAAETGKITALRGLRFTYTSTSGNTSLTLERNGPQYSFTGRVHDGPAGTAPRELALVSGPGGEEGFRLATGAGGLTFGRHSVSGVSADPKLSAIMTALYLALLRDAGSGLVRTVAFGGRPGMDGPNYGWTSCSTTNVPYVTSDIEYRQGAVSFGKVRVCEVEVTYTCNWYKCEVLYPNLEPDICYCKATCYKKSHNTGRCEVVDAE